ncbi:ABC transporter substrate-binding protein [Candidatus Phytoplasma phoenicium]|uniref:Glycerol-3-phosphate ABC transporter, periplasmic glycerol-3-phosphate-binding protein n=1 Tax=Candidatus Phytoplasma phoenicium TaxID=198422 RepID=A0A0L0MKL3_9MOLU|nr:extracellular solute-binding protein [Candidatus Phytoplasma phoenicium]KND62549.1 Glycerol-3-phosphate ABC transporter, periplasmic glycerol-3-phosphate-binding protein [Candidatus Phytoplasma phoenicium]
MVLKDKWTNIPKKFIKDIFFVILLFFILFIFILIINTTKTPNKPEDFQPTYQKVSEWFKKYNTEEQQQEYFRNSKMKKVEIVFWHNLFPEEIKVMQKIVKEFEEKYTQIKVRINHKGGWEEITRSVTNALPINKQPHLVVSYPDHIEIYSKSNKVVPLNEFITQDKAKNNEQIQKQIFPDFLQQDSNKNNYLPFLKTTEVMFYNKDLFQKIRGLKNQKEEVLIDQYGEIKKSNIEWSDMEIICEALKKTISNPDFIPIIYESESNVINYNYRYEYNDENEKNFPTTKEEATKLLKNYQPLLRTIRYFKKLYDKQYLTTSKLNKKNKNAKDLFYKGKYGIFISSTRRTNNFFDLNFELGFHQIPIMNKEKKDQNKVKGTNLAQGSNINLFYSPKEDEMIASWMFLKYLVSMQTYEKLFNEKSGLCIVRKDLIDKLQKQYDDKKKLLPKNTKKQGKEFVKLEFLKFALELAKPEENRQNRKFFITPFFEDVYIFRDLLKDLFVKILSLELQGREMEKQIDKIFQEAYERFTTI